MKVKKLLLVILSVITALAACSVVACTKTNPNNSTNSSSSSTGGGYISSNWDVMPENTNPNLQYFGYFHSDGFRSQGSYIGEIATLQNSNVVMINSAFSFEIAREKIETAKELGFKVIFSVHGFFTGGQIKVANSASLVENYLDVWQETQTALNEYVQDGTILAFYFDEPAWNGIKEEDFRTVTKLIRDTYPNTKIMTTMTVYDIGVAKYPDYPEINASYNEYCTDVSYDSYAKWNDETRRSYIEALKSKATNDQYIWGCATGFSTNPEQIQELFSAIKGMYTEAIQEPRYAGILPFSYADGQEGDWGYGLHSFFNNTSDYYSRDLKQLYVNIGREVCGMEPYDFAKDVEIVLYAPNEVYEIGETIDLPPAGATDGMGNEVDFELTITSPSGATIPAGSFVAEESGAYTVTVTAGSSSKSVNISVRSENEISLFDDPAYLSDASGTDADTWCWPRQIDTTFARNGGGSLRVTPHATDGTWPRVVFARNGHQLWDISQTGGVSMWVYNPSDTVIKGFALVVSDENFSSTNSVYSFKDIPSNEWTEVKLELSTIRASKPELDLTQVTIFYGNAAADYQNRTNFYIDDVMLLEQTEQDILEDGVIDFEYGTDLALIGGDDADKWCWPSQVSEAQAHSGTKSLKVTPHASDGTWPNVVFKNFSGEETYDLTNMERIRVWVYFDSDNAIETLGLKISNANDSNSFSKTATIPARTWTEVVLTAEDIANAVTDKTAAYVKFSQLGGTYTDRSAFYLDDFTIVWGEGGSSDGNTPVDPPVTEPEIPGGGSHDVPDTALGFEEAGDILKVSGTSDDVWCWKPTLSTEQAQSGTQSLKITVHATDGTWPNVVFMNGESETYDLTHVTAIAVWVYFDSDAPITTLGFKICNAGETNKFEKTFPVASRVWTEVYLAMSELANATTDLENAYVKFAQLGGGYSDRSNFYLDSFYIVYEEDYQPEEPNQPEEVELIVLGSVDFESEEDLATMGDNADDIWTWQLSISTEQAHGGNSSLKVTVRQDGAVWPNVVIGLNEGGTVDLTNATEVSMWIYFDSENTQNNFYLKINNGEKVNEVLKNITLPARTWTQVSITKTEILKGAADIDLTQTRICIAQCAGTYDDRSNFYIDDFAVCKAPDTIGFESEEDLATMGDNADDIWTWQLSISTEQAHGGNSSLKVTVRQDGAVWPNVVIGLNEGGTVDLTNATEVSMWIYFDSENTQNNFYLKINNGEKVNEVLKNITLPARTWTKVTITKAEILKGAADIDLTQTRICIAQCAGTYDDRSNFYIDDFMVE